MLFLGMTTGMTPEARKTVTKDASFYGFIILLFFALVGKYILLFFGISTEALELAGGLILLIMGIQMVREGDRPKSQGGNVEPDAGIVPLATPLLAGPGAISLVIILMSRPFYPNQILTIISVGLLFVIVFVFFSLSERILKIMGPKSMKAITRIFGLLVAGFAIQYMLLAMQGLGLLTVP
ncbi:MAG: MarC family protein [Candidatus Thermoplasmatota archaeon]|nr:MarC family protein [Candidatus Thermoplasmatota archaeon]